MNHRLALFSAALALTLPLAAPAAAQSYPDKPVTLVVPYPPGGNVDISARILAEALSRKFKQTFVVENKAGAGGQIGGNYVARSTPDGYTLFVSSNGPLQIAELVFAKPMYQWKQVFHPISTIALSPVVLTASPKLTVNSVDELLAKAKAEPMVMGSPGAGTINHLASELLQLQSGVKWDTAHYRGNAPEITDLIGGQVLFSFEQTTVAMPYYTSGKLRPLAVASSERVPMLPNVPTMKELGYKDYEAVTYTALVAPKDTPKAVIDALAAATREVLAEPDVAKRLTDSHAIPHGLSPEETTRFLDAETAKWSEVIRRANITAE